MKLTDSNANAHAKNLPKGIDAILLFGYDEAQVRARVKQLTQQVCANVNDAFQVFPLTMAKITEDEAVLETAIFSPSLMGGRRVIQITGATDKLTASLKTSLPRLETADCLLLITAGELPKTSSLRKLFEEHPRTLGWICYKEEGAALHRAVQEELNKKGLQMPLPAQQELLASIDNERGLIAAEIEKISLYAHPHTALTLDDVTACAAPLIQGSIDNFCYAVLEKKQAIIQQEYDKAQVDSINDVVLIRSLQNMVARLLHVKALLQEGKPLNIAMKILKPPVFFKQEARFQRLLNNLSEDDLTKRLGAFLKLEVAARRGHEVGSVLVQRGVL